MQSIAQETRYRLEVRALGGDGWRPAVAGRLNQTRWSDEQASEFETPDSAMDFAENFILPGGVEAIRVVRVSDGLAVCTVEDLWRDGEWTGEQIAIMHDTAHAIRRLLYEAREKCGAEAWDNGEDENDVLTAHAMRRLLDEARDKYGAEAWDEGEVEADVLYLVFGDVTGEES